MTTKRDRARKWYNNPSVPHWKKERAKYRSQVKRATSISSDPGHRLHGYAIEGASPEEMREILQNLMTTVYVSA